MIASASASTTSASVSSFGGGGGGTTPSVGCGPTPPKWIGTTCSLRSDEIATSDGRVPGAMEAIVGASQILTRTLVQRMVERQPPDILIRSGLDGIGGLDFFKAKAILAAAEPIKDEVKRALERALAATG